MPPDFDSDRSKGMAFLNSCQMYTCLCPKEFDDEQTKILWAMSYMKYGRAQRWTAQIFHWKQLPENLGYPSFLDWDDFRLESTAYFQKERSLDDYLDEFQNLIADAGYTDPKTTVVKFRRGLESQPPDPGHSR